MRRCCALALGLAPSDVAIDRTKGRKPFLAERCRLKTHAIYAHSVEGPPSSKPNFNFNVSHEGKFVVLAAEPHCVVGVDVAAPEQFRKRGEDAEDAEVALAKFFGCVRDMLTEGEWAYVRATEGCAKQAGRFRYFWSCKEAFAKARGDGLGFGLGRAHFDLTFLKDHDRDRDHEHTYAENNDQDDNKDNRASPAAASEASPTEEFLPRRGGRFVGSVSVDGRPLPEWRFLGETLRDGHVVTVARGPPRDVVDAIGDFRRTLSKDELIDEDFEQPEPAFTFLTLRDLVPPEALETYDQALATDARFLRQLKRRSTEL